MRRRPRSTLFPYTTLFRSEDRAVVGDVRVGELHEAPQPAELILPEQLRAQPLAPLQLREALEGGLPLQALVQRVEDATDEALVHAGLLRAALSSSRACSTLSAQSKRRARRTMAGRSHGRSSAFRRALARTAASPRGTRKPSCPARTITGAPPTAVATTGVPQARDSRSTLGQPSDCV